MKLSVKHPAHDAEGGFGLIEVLVSMLMLALLAAALAPVLMATLQLSSSNGSTTSATELADQQIASARSAGTTCASLRGVTAATGTSVGGVAITATPAVTCPTKFPGAARFSVSVTQAGSSVALATAATLIYVVS